MLTTNIWNWLEELKAPLKLRIISIMFNGNIISMLINIECWLEEINYNIGVTQGCPLSPTFLDLDTDKLEYCLEDVDCANIVWSIANISFS